ncbi:MAG: hypothetical protein ABUS57_02150 [Pseudomonadota bacterium]
MGELGIWAGWGLAAAGAAGLRWSWRERGGAHAFILFAAWALIVAALLAFACSGEGADRGVAISLLAISTLTYLLIASGLTPRTAKAKSATTDALDPAQRPAKIWRALWRFLAAGPLTSLASLAIAVAFALHVNMPLAERMAIAAITQPLIWAALMAWAMADARLARVTLITAAITIAGSLYALYPLLPGAR